jgi:hypothetical protein
VFSLYNVNQTTPVDGYLGQFLENNATNTRLILSKLGGMACVGVLNYPGSETISEVGIQIARQTLNTDSKSSTRVGTAFTTVGYTFSAATADSIVSACNVNGIPSSGMKNNLRPAPFKPMAGR